MKIVVAMDSFKGSLSAQECCEIIRQAFLSVNPTNAVTVIPMADGGEGTAECLIRATGGQCILVASTGMLGEKRQGYFGLLDAETAIIETAVNSGLTTVVEEKRDVMRGTTYGTGELIAAALEHGCRKLFVALGGSGTNDGGIGALAALGVKFLDTDGNLLYPCGKNMQKVRQIDVSGLHPAIQDADFYYACDVVNPFCGKQGAAYVFAKQKGATSEQIVELDAGLQHLCALYQREFGVDLMRVAGSGAAGGLAGGLFAVLGGSFLSGYTMLAQAAGLEAQIAGADLVVTGEGKTDAQTLMGKLPFQVVMTAKRYGVPSILLSGCIELEAQAYRRLPLLDAVALVSAPTPYAMTHASELLYARAVAIAEKYAG